MNAKERVIAGALIVAIFASVLFVIAYATSASRLYEGLALAFATAGFTAAAIGWAFWIIPQEHVIDLRDDYPSPGADRTDETRELREGFAEVTRRRVLVRLLYTALGVFGITLIVPVRSLGPAPDGSLFSTKWRRGMLLVRENGKPVHVNDLNVDSVITVFPQGAVDDTQSQTILIRLPEDESNTARGYIAYSKLCTHAGCPVALYRAQARQLMCPCHQSVFDVRDDGAVVSGPADHALPRLPIGIDRSGLIIALGDYPVAVGPGFWERG